LYVSLVLSCLVSCLYMLDIFNPILRLPFFFFLIYRSGCFIIAIYWSYSDDGCICSKKNEED